MSFNKSFNFSGRRVLVTGGAKGIGLSIAKLCIELNAEVFVIDKDEQALTELTLNFPSIKALQVDLSDWDATRKSVESILPIHHLANNAGFVIPRRFLQIDLESIDKTFDVNFKAALNVGQVVAKGIIAHGIKNGTIVNISSIMDSLTEVNHAVYSATKAALTMLTKSMAVELAHHGIRVNCIRPGGVNTDIFNFIDPNEREEYLEQGLKRTLNHKMIQPEEIANAFVFLSCSISAAISGTDLTVDDGTTVL